MKALFKFILLTALRDKLYLSIMIIIFAIFGLSNIIGISALSEQSQMQLTYFSFLSRFIIVSGMILFICFYINKEFENREIDFILSKQISRSTFILSHWLGFNLVGIILLIPTLLIILIFNSPNFIGLIWWSITIILELMLISTFAIVSSLILKTAVISILSTFSFYFISRMMGFFVYSISLPNNITSNVKTWFDLSEISLKLISSFFPRLDLFAKSDFLINGISNFQDIYLIIIQSLIYIPFMLFISFYDFKRKQF